MTKVFCSHTMNYICTEGWADSWDDSDKPWNFVTYNRLDITYQTLCVFFSLKCPEDSNAQGQKEDQKLSRVGGRVWGLAVMAIGLIITQCG